LGLRSHSTQWTTEPSRNLTRQTVRGAATCTNRCKVPAALEVSENPSHGREGRRFCTLRQLPTWQERPPSESRTIACSVLVWVTFHQVGPVIAMTVPQPPRWPRRVSGSRRRAMNDIAETINARRAPGQSNHELEVGHEPQQTGQCRRRCTATGRIDGASPHT